MNPLELRTLIHTGLSKKYGTQYGDVLTVEPLPPKPGDPVQMMVTAPDPSGNLRKFRVSITEE